MDVPPTKGRVVRDYEMRWGIENMFSDLKSRSFGLMESKIQKPERLEKMLLLMTIALHWAVSSGMYAKQKAAAAGRKRGF